MFSKHLFLFSSLPSSTDAKPQIEKHTLLPLRETIQQSQVLQPYSKQEKTWQTLLYLQLAVDIRPRSSSVIMQSVWKRRT
jgi:hypothetical protein